jgi:hypothetical protein
MYERKPVIFVSLSLADFTEHDDLQFFFLQMT